MMMQYYQPQNVWKCFQAQNERIGGLFSMGHVPSAVVPLPRIAASQLLFQ
jgi:hypothetical protein